YIHNRLRDSFRSYVDALFVPERKLTTLYGFPVYECDFMPPTIITFGSPVYTPMDFIKPKRLSFDEINSALGIPSSYLYEEDEDVCGWESMVEDEDMDDDDV